jgi:hypothetical protein
VHTQPKGGERSSAAADSARESRQWKIFRRGWPRRHRVARLEAGEDVPGGLRRSLERASIVSRTPAAFVRLKIVDHYEVIPLEGWSEILGLRRALSFPGHCPVDCTRRGHAILAQSATKVIVFQ